MAHSQTSASFTTVEVGKLCIITSDIEARPLSFISDGQRQGFEPALARVMCDRLDLTPQWFDIPTKSFYSTLSSGDYDVICFNQAITQEHRAWADFTRSYGRSDTAALVREASDIDSKADLSEKRVGFFKETVSNSLLEQLPTDIEPIFFDGEHKVTSEMLSALQTGDIDAIVEDSLLLMAMEAQDTNLRTAFEIQTRHPFGIGVLPGNRELLDALNGVLNALIADGTLNRLWAQWIPYKPYPF
ncbi:ABC transporter substrate-binding protein [Oscillatoria sp. CS-180]|uniref:substrate-binding periplasmic protein n=1 Tax=Oscillatoria sp. CS-180 TaxID=3021720 RepID=UPI00232B0890|nr:ABC transporter substrate-binding protein [Oscillatoria sp. CS-180]MDB9528377.1 ABC transporter substrate-binding protein [Oscillatoria sp. CS-180]